MFRLWGIRHARYYWLAFRFAVWWQLVGRNYWLTPNAADIDYLDAVWRGEV